MTLTGLTPKTWERAVASWLGNRWATLVDLQTLEEDTSDLVLLTDVHQTASDYDFDIQMICIR